jgi:hypothetical protein
VDGSLKAKNKKPDKTEYRIKGVPNPVIFVSLPN